ncbi:MAG: acyl-CoA dehydrogenase family protein, partial [Comamonas sp.]|nr:acyl-CoA dehydrogenase family protein [Comamonas sp.]
MDLTYTPAQKAFRAQVRAWLKDNVPKQRLKSYDTREGFEQHREWEAKLAEAGYSAVMW